MFKAKGNPRVLIGDIITVKAGEATATTGAVTSATKASPCVVTETSTALESGDVIRISGCDEMTQLNGNEYEVVKLTANTFSLKDKTGAAVSSAAWTAETTGGVWVLLEEDEGTATMKMNSKVCTFDFTEDWNDDFGYTYKDVLIGDYVCAWQTDAESDTGEHDWMLIKADDFEHYYVVEGA